MKKLFYVLTALLVMSFYSISYASETAEIKLNATDEARIAKNIPVMMEFGGSKCVQCKKMEPVIEELKKELSGKVEIKKILVDDDAATAEKFKVMLIPTQIFIDKNGAEVFRHEGFFSKEEIMAQLKKMGVE